MGKKQESIRRWIRDYWPPLRKFALLVMIRHLLTFLSNDVIDVRTGVCCNYVEKCVLCFRGGFWWILRRETDQPPVVRLQQVGETSPEQHRPRRHHTRHRSPANYWCCKFYYKNKLKTTPKTNYFSEIRAYPVLFLSLGCLFSEGRNYCLKIRTFNPMQVHSVKYYVK